MKYISVIIVILFVVVMVWAVDKSLSDSFKEKEQKQAERITHKQGEI